MTSLRLLTGLLLMLAPLLAGARDGIPLSHPPTEATPAARAAGAETVLGLCMSCHDLQYLHYRDLQAIMPQARIDALRGEHSMEDRLLSMMPADARKSMFGLVPPDLSLIAKAREGGADYIYTLLISYRATPDGGVDNLLFPGIRMPDPLGSASTGDLEGVKKTAAEVAAFLEWAADPRAGDRHTLGMYVLGYLALLTLLLYLNKRRVWRRLEREHPAEAGR